MTKYKQYTIIDGKAKWVIVDENGNVVNKYPNKEEYTSLQKETYKFRTGFYNKTNICDKCKTNKLTPGNAYKEYDNKGI